MPNRYPKCDVCGFRHREGRCRGRRAQGGLSEIGALNANECQSRGILVQDLTRLFRDRGVPVYRDPFSPRAEEIARRAILRADTLGMEHYGPAPPPLDEKRDMIDEAVEELLDGIYYLARQVAKLEDLRERVTP